ncbi:vacuolar protein sorting-associated protein vts1 [Podospora australis]|uniref:Vacuolar protein sorting-associated protein vts1 n=1 Tax=Podospora australis TaxID=1536484 RepID=A0AAN6X4K9_9PEZI|nr:vacuolar protein sorting-associated protein vts1 [Podospora australis]
MADSVPAALRQADVNLWKCATKAVQLQNVKPIIAYWCEYWVVNQILAKQLHLENDEMMRYTTTLMDKLEETKAEYAHEDAVTDDATSQAYVEQFAQETLDRAERVVKANKVTQQTATTFDAAATFFHLVNIWGPADQETQQKIKYAKWNAARIVKAIKEGQDPNESNPRVEEPQQPALDPSDAEVLNMGSTSSGIQPRPATMEEVPDAETRRDAAGVSLPPSPASAGPSDGGLKLPGVPSGFGDSTQPGYFDSPSMPSPISPPSHHPTEYQEAPDLPPAPSGANWAHSPPSPETSPPPMTWSQPPPPSNPPSSAGWAPPPNTHHQPYTPSAPSPAPAPPTFSMNPPSTAAVSSPPVNPPTDPYSMNMTPTAHTARPTVPTISSAPPPVAYAPAPYQPARNVVVDEAAMATAQKHAKWAISALNFEDVPTAVRELRKALEFLGAT